jgi:hypothetical protein
MRILDESSDRALTSVLILLTPDEAKELLDGLTGLTSEKGDHIHVNNERFSIGITVAIYTPQNSQFFNKRVRQLIEIGE